MVFSYLGAKSVWHLRAEFLAARVFGGGSSTRNITTVEDFFTGDNPCAKTLGVFLAHGFFQSNTNHTLIQKTSKHTFQCLGLHEYENMFMIQLASQHFGRFHLARRKRIEWPNAWIRGARRGWRSAYLIRKHTFHNSTPHGANDRGTFC